MLFRTTLSCRVQTEHQGGFSGVLFGEEVGLLTRLSQGCSPIGPHRTIPQAQRNILITLDGRRALDVLKEDIGEELSRDLMRIGATVFVGLPIQGSDTGDYLVRNLVGIEVKTSGTVGADDFKGLRTLAEQAGKRFLRGAVLYAGDEAVPFGRNLHAIPISALGLM